MSSAYNYHISIILPCYNPTTDFAGIVKDSFLKIKNSVNKDIELIIVDDGSFKNFNEEAIRGFFAELSEVKIISYAANKGKGYALREGTKAANGELIIYTDIDFPYTHQSFLKIYSALANDKVDVAMGVRNREYYEHIPKTRVRISKLLRFFIKKFLRIPSDDTQCGLKGFNQTGKEVFLQTTINRYLFDLEFIFLAARKKAVIKTVEVELRSGIQLSSMRWKILLQESGNFLKIFAQSIF